MADDGEDNDENEQDDQKPAGVGGGKKKVILIIVLVLVIISISVGGTVAVLSFNKVEETSEEIAEEESEPELPNPAIYYPLKPSIIVTFEARGRRRYLQADITLMTRDEEVIAAVELHMPMIRNALVMLIGGQSYEEIQTAEGKELLRVACINKLRSLLETEIGKPGIDQVLFTNFVMQ